MIKEQLQTIQREIEEACKHAGRDASEVTLIAVSKTKPAELVREAYDAGARDFGENKVQEILAKAPLFPEDTRWHMIGHLQRNKVHQVLSKVVLIHSVDSVRLAQEIQKEAEKQDLDVDILLEINVAREESKHGFFLEEAEEAIRTISQFSRVHIKGLMTIAPFVEDAEDNREIFQKLYQFSVDIVGKNIDNVSMGVLSMGMSGDFRVAVEEGATMVRVGTSIFGAR